MKIGYKSDTGKRRELDEDSIMILRCDTIHESREMHTALLIVADGMGGHNAGEVASYMAATKVAEEIVEFMLEERKRYLFEENGKNPLKTAIEEANKHIFNEVKENPHYKGMGTTVTAAVVLGSAVYVGHVGDSRAYIVNREEINQITKDHSLVQEMVDRKEITPEEARIHPRKNIITRAVGTYQDIDVDTLKKHICGDDYLLICCDGLTDMVADEEIHKTFAHFDDPQKICDELVKKANSNGGLDNISVIVAQFDELKSKKDFISEKTQVKPGISEDLDKTRVLKE